MNTQATQTRRGAHLTREHQRYARSCVRRESLQRSGRKGAEATARKYGPDFLLRKVREYRLANPSFPELVMIGLLATLKVKFEREWQIAGSLYCADFYLPEQGKAIEIHGAIHGRLEVEKRKQHDKEKARLCRQLGVALLVVQESEFEHGPALIERVKEFLR